MTPESSHSWRLIFFAVIAAVLACLVALVLAEGVLRLTPYEGLLHTGAEPSEYWVADAEKGYAIRPNQSPITHRFTDLRYDIWSNSLGCFDYEYGGETPYIFLTGDSFAWGYASFPDKWGTQLESLLGERVVKCGVSGYGTRQELLNTKTLLEKLPAPEHIVVSYYENDVADDATFPNYIMYRGTLVGNPGTTSLDVLEDFYEQRYELSRKYCMAYMPAHPTLQRVKCFFRHHSVLYLLLQDVIKQVVPVRLLRIIGIINQPVAATGRHEQSDPRPNQEAVAAFKKLAAQYQAELLFVIVPRKGRELETTGNADYVAIKSFMDEHGISYLDPLEDFQVVAGVANIPLYWRFDPHLNSAGNQLLGLLVARRVLIDTNRASSPLMEHVEEELRENFSYETAPIVNSDAK